MTPELAPPVEPGVPCPYAAVCMMCVCAREDDVCFPHERETADREHACAEPC